MGSGPTSSDPTCSTPTTGSATTMFSADSTGADDTSDDGLLLDVGNLETDGEPLEGCCAVDVSLGAQGITADPCGANVPQVVEGVLTSSVDQLCQNFQPEGSGRKVAS